MVIATGDHAEAVAIEAERSTLGTCMLYPDAVDACAALRSSDFVLPRHQLTWRAILAAHQRSGVADPLSTAAELENTPGALAEVGGYEALADLVEGVLSPAEVGHHAEIIIEAATRRRVKSGIATALQRLTEGTPMDAVRDLIGHVISDQQRATAKPWQRYSLGQYLATSAAPWIIQNVFRANQVVLLGAFSTVGKSTIAAGMAWAIMSGAPWSGHAVRPGPVIGLIGEGMRGFSLRMEAHRKLSGGQLPEANYLELVRFKAPLSDPSGQAAMVDLIHEIAAERAASPALIIIDTLSSHWSADEDSQESVAPFMRAVAQIAEEHDCAVLIVHHTVKSRGKYVMPELQDFRGSGALIGAADCIMSACATKDSKGVIAKIIKCKDDEPPGEFVLTRKVVPLGLDDDGSEITGAVLVDGKQRHDGGVKSATSESARERQEKADAMRERMREVMHVMRELGGMASSKDSVFALMAGKTDSKRGAFNRLIDIDEIRPTGSVRGRRYYLTTHPDCPEVCVRKKEPKKGRGGAATAATSPPPTSRGGVGAESPKGADGAECGRASA